LCYATAGVIQVDGLLSNQLRVSPYMLSLPSGVTQPTPFTLNLTWDAAAGPAAAAAPPAAAAVGYSVLHEPAAAITVDNGWYGTESSIEYVYQAVDVAFDNSKVVVNTAKGTKTELKVRVQSMQHLQPAAAAVASGWLSRCAHCLNDPWSWQSYLHH
jgi:hypothetical protein